MRSLTFNQLQLRILLILFLFFISALVGYRYFIELPKLERSIASIAEGELDILTFSIENMLKNASLTNYDYAVWTSTYDFMVSQNQSYVDEYLVDDTFVSLSIDGMFFINKDLEIVFAKGFHSKIEKPLEFSFYDFKKHPENLSILPAPEKGRGSSSKKGFLSTKNGPAIYSVNQVRTSDSGGEHRGFLISVKLIENIFTEDLSKYTSTNITFFPEHENIDFKTIKVWNKKKNLFSVQPYTDILLEDMNGRPVAVIKMEHSVGYMPNLLNDKILIFTLLIIFIFYIFYRFISTTIIFPVNKLSRDIESRHSSNKHTKLSEKYTIKELITVSKNVNKLMHIVQTQNELLAKQANTDQLTQVMNRYGLETELNKYENQCIRFNVGFIAIMCDIDNFKIYNDSFGHIQGDTALYKVAQSLKQHCKRPTDILARFGGEEFMLLFSEMPEKSLHKKMQDIISSIETLTIPHSNSPKAAHVTISLGATIVRPSDVVDFSLPINEIIKTADNALYQAKDFGRNRFIINNFSSKN